MMTTQESKLVEYLKEQPVVMNNTILVDRNIVEKSMTYLLENGITILSLSFVNLSDSGVEKNKEAYISYLDKSVSIDKMMNDIKAEKAEYTHIEISVRLKNQP
jgi:poly(3-hydroxyalkanoate) synthetase